MGLDAPCPFRAAKEGHSRMRVGETEWYTDLSISVCMTERFMVKGVQIHNPNPSYCNFRLFLLVLAQEERIKSTDHVFFITALVLFYDSASFIPSYAHGSYGETKIDEIWS